MGKQWWQLRGEFSTFFRIFSISYVDMQRFQTFFLIFISINLWFGIAYPNTVESATALNCVDGLTQILKVLNLSEAERKVRADWLLRKKTLSEYNQLIGATISSSTNHSEFEESFIAMVKNFDQVDNGFNAETFLGWLQEKKKLSYQEWSLYRAEKDLSYGSLFKRLYKEYAPHTEQNNPLVRFKSATQDLILHTKKTLESCKADEACFKKGISEYIEMRKDSSCLFQNPNALKSLVYDYAFSYGALGVNQVFFVKEGAFPWDYALSSALTSISFTKVQCEAMFRTRYQPGSYIDPIAPQKLMTRLKQEGFFKVFQETAVYRHFRYDWARISFVALWANAVYVAAGEIQNYFIPQGEERIGPFERYAYFMLFSGSWAQIRSRFIFEPLKVKYIPAKVQELKNIIGEGTQLKKIMLTTLDWASGMGVRFGFSTYGNYEYLEILQKWIFPLLSYHVNETSQKLKSKFTDFKKYSETLIPDHLWIHYEWPNGPHTEPRVEVEFSDELIEAFLYEGLE